MKIAILTCNKCPNLAPRDEHLPALFAQRNVALDIVVWNKPDVDWKAYDGLLFRSVWDYHLLPTEFNNWLDELEQLGIKTLNPIETIKQNQHKFYLKQLQQQGIETIPTVYIEKTNNLDLSSLETQHKWPRAIIKPAVSASSYKTTLFNSTDWAKVENEYRELAKHRELLLQPFMPEIIEAGEISMVFFNKQYSHAVKKQVRPGDFRIQAEFGGVHQIFNPEEEVIQAAENIIALINGPLLYARVDGLLQNGRFILMELEMLEPDLFFDAHPDASKRYVNAAIELFAPG